MCLLTWKAWKWSGRKVSYSIKAKKIDSCAIWLRLFCWKVLSFPQCLCKQRVQDNLTLIDGGVCTHSGFSLSQQNAVYVFFVFHNCVWLLVFVTLSHPDSHLFPEVSAWHSQYFIYEYKSSRHGNVAELQSAPEACTTPDPNRCTHPTVEASQAEHEEAEVG